MGATDVFSKVVEPLSKKDFVVNVTKSVVTVV